MTEFYKHTLTHTQVALIKLTKSKKRFSTFCWSTCNVMITLSLLSFCVQIYSNREMEDQLTKIREVLSDDKHDWEHRVVAVRVTHWGGSAWIQWWNTDLLLLSLLILCSWRRSALSCWLGQLSTRGSLSSCVSWRLPWNCQLKTCAHRWSGRPASHWGKSPSWGGCTVLWTQQLTISSH